MAYKLADSMNVDAVLHIPLATAQLVRFDFAEPIDAQTRVEDAFRLDLCLSPRPGNARACYLDHWNSSRFERIGNLFLTPPGEVVHHRSDGCCQQASLICELHPNSINEWFEEDLHWTDKRLLGSLDIRDANIQGLLLRLAQEAKQPGMASDTMIELIAGQLAIEVTRYCSKTRDTVSNGGLTPWRLRLLEDRLNVVGAPPTLTELSELCKISVRQLTRGFRVSKGCSIGDYLANNRVAQSKKLLATAQSIKAVAYTMGFSSSSSFCYAFRRATGETPSQFRSRLLQIH